MLVMTTAPASALLPLTSFAITSSDATAVKGQTVTLAVNMMGGASAPTGTVNILDGVTTICPSLPLTNNGVTSFAGCDVSNLAVGTHSITANYSGDVVYDPDVSTNFQPAFSQQVAKASTTTTTTSNLPSPDFGDNVTFTATVAPVAPGAGV